MPSLEAVCGRLFGNPGWIPKALWGGALCFIPILNLFSLMDSLLKRVNLDLRMRMYSVLATSQEDGAMEFVGDSAPVQYILDTHGKSIRNYLRRHNPDPSSPSGIAPEPLDTFIRSCAGSCVTTYILGIGEAAQACDLIRQCLCTNLYVLQCPALTFRAQRKGHPFLNRGVAMSGKMR